MDTPQILFKYKALSTAQDIARVLEILSKEKIYFPTCEQLNDPYEGTLGADEVSGWAGKGTYDQYDWRYPMENQLRKAYRILSLSATCFSPQMWAYYAGTYSGLCIGFFTSNHFSNVKCVEYRNSRIRYFPDLVGSKELDYIFYNNLLIKHSDWSSEQEWRLIERSNDAYINYDYNEIACIIVGYNTDQNIVTAIQGVLKNHIPVFRAVPGARTLRLRLLPYEYEVDHTGTTPPWITDVTQLLDALSKQA